MSFGMTEVYASALPASVDGEIEFRLPRVAGYVALKIKAWIDRSSVHDLKDAPDLALALYWAGESIAFTDRFWSDPDLVGACNADASLGGATLLGGDARSILGERADSLCQLFTSESRERLARTMGSSAAELRLGDVERRTALLDALVTGLRG